MTRGEFGGRFKTAREAAGWTQEGAAKAIGVAQPRIAEYEAGKRIPPLPRLIEVVAILDLDPQILIPEFFAK